MDAYATGGSDAAAAYYSEDCAVEDFPELTDRAAMYVGPQGFMERNRNFTEVWHGFVAEPTEFIDAGDNHVVVIVAMRGAGPSSGIALNDRFALVWQICDGKITGDRAFTSRADALRAVGLEE